MLWSTQPRATRMREPAERGRQLRHKTRGNRNTAMPSTISWRSGSTLDSSLEGWVFDSRLGRSANRSSNCHFLRMQPSSSTLTVFSVVRQPVTCSPGLAQSALSALLSRETRFSGCLVQLLVRRSLLERQSQTKNASRAVPRRRQIVAAHT